MAARGSNPVRRAGPGARPAARPAGNDQQPTDAGAPAGTVLALPGLAVAPASGQQLAAGLRARSARPELLVGSAGDPAEVAADALADAVVHRLLAPTGDTGAPTDQAGAPPPATGVLSALRRTSAAPTPAPSTGGGTAIGLAGGAVDAATEQALHAARSSGTALAPALRRQYEDAFGADFSAVRVHAGPASARLNSALGARAFTLGSDIYFGDRVPAGATAADRHLMAHELAHTLQDDGTAHRQLVRRLAVQITPSYDQVVVPSADEKMKEATAPHHPVPDAHPVDEAVRDVEMIGGLSGGAGPAVTGTASQDVLFIETVAIVGRPAPLFTGSMGDHLTAFVITRKGVENAIAGQPFSVAVDELKEIVAELAELPGWRLVDSLKATEPAVETDTAATDVSMEATSTTEAISTEAISITEAISTTEAIVTEAKDGTSEDVPGKETGGAHRRPSHHARFVTAREHLAACEVLLDAADSDDLRIIRLQDYIAAYLELRELVPLSVSNWQGANRGPGGKGDGETGLQGLLSNPETKVREPGQLRRDFLSTIATYRLAQAAVEPNAKTLAVLMPGLHPDLSADKRTELMARQHVQSVLTNFPANFGALADDILLAEGHARAERKRAAAVEASSKARSKARAKAKSKPKAKAKKRGLVVDSSDSESEADFEADFEAGVEEAKSDGPVAERSVEQNFAIIENHLIRLVRMRYAEVARKELTHQRRIIELFPGTDESAIAGRNAARLTTFLTAKPAPGSTAMDEKKDDEEEKGEEGSRGAKRLRGSETAPVDDLYGSLPADEAKKVYTGRDFYTGKKVPVQAAELAVQLVLDETGAVDHATVERQGKHTKGAHTLPWMQWLIWLNADIRGRQPADALTAFTTITLPKIRRWLGDGSPSLGTDTPTEPTGSSDLAVPTAIPADTTMVEESEEKETAMVEESEEKETEAKGETETDTLPAGSMPRVELQDAIAHALEMITAAPDSSVLDATDTGGKGEAPYRVKLAAYQNGGLGLVPPEELVRWILALCDVGEADTDLAARTVTRALETAQQDYRKAYDDSGIATYELTDLVDRASNGKAGVFEYDSAADPDSESESDERAKKKRRKSGSGRSSPGITKRH